MGRGFHYNNREIYVPGTESCNIVLFESNKPTKCAAKEICASILKEELTLLDRGNLFYLRRANPNTIYI